MKAIRIFKNALIRSIALQVLIGITALETRSQVVSIDTFRIKQSVLIGNYQNIDFFEGGFSGITVVPGTNGTEFYINSDRGPNIDSKNAACTPTYDKMYPFPNYAPKIHRVKIQGDSILILNTLTIKKPDGNNASGIINPTGFGSTATEQPRKDTISNCANISSVILSKDIWGIDPEGIAIGRDNDFWLCEEGGATIWNLGNDGKVIARYSPYANLSGAQPEDIMIDSVFKYRKNNRGFEGITICPDGKVYAIIQSPILYPTKAIGEASYIHRIVEIDPGTGAQKMFAYLNPGVVGSGSNQIKAKDWKIGDMAAVNDSTFLVLEQAVAGNNIQRKIYLININGATEVNSGLYGTKTLEQLKDSAGLASNGIVPVKKTLFIDLMSNGWPAMYDKAEGLTIINDSTIAICNDNDYGQFSPNEDGIAVATGIRSNIFLIHLNSSSKITNFSPSNSNITDFSQSTAIFSRQISQASDDQEEWLQPNTASGETISGAVVGQIDYNSSDLELGQEFGLNNRNPQMVGLRFQNIQFDNNAQISKAWLRFEVDATNKNANPCELTIFAEDTDSASTFNANAAYTAFELSMRRMLSDSVIWNVPVDSFTVVDQRYNSVDISPLLEKIVNRPGWKKGNAVAFYIKGKGTREVEAYEGEPSAAAVLNIEYMLTKADSALHHNIDSLLNIANAKTDTNYTTPSFTKLKMAIVKATSLKDSASALELMNALNQLQSKYHPYSIVMNINGDPSTNMAFNWYNNAGITGGKVQIVEGVSADFSNPAITVSAKTDSVKNKNYCVSANNLFSLAGIANNTKKSYMSNKVVVTGLMPNTIYSFRVGNDSAWSETGTFTTAKNSKEEFSFVYFTDPQANTQEMFDISQKTTHAAMLQHPDANFWLSCGDLVETSGNSNSEWEYEQFFKTQQDIWMHYPIVPVAGNHDKSANKNFTTHFNTDSVAFDHEKSTVPGSVYSFVYGDALFMALSYEDYGVAGYLDSLSNWMKNEVNSHPDVKWRIAFYHKTMYTGSASHQSDADAITVRNKMAPLFDSLKIDLALQGHDHIYEVIGPVNNKQLVPSSVSNQQSVMIHPRENVTGKLGGTFNVEDGTLYFLNNSAGKKKYEPRSQAQMDAAEAGLGINNYFGLFSGRFGQTGRPTFSNITVSSDTIVVSTYEVFDNGSTQLFDQFKVVKPILPFTPGNIAGETTVCQTQENVNYSVPAISNATSYQWKLPKGIIGNSSSSSINVHFTDSAVSGKIIVKGVNGTGIGDSSFIFVNVNPIPSAAVLLTGNTSVCQGDQNILFQTTSITNATSYLWTLPGGFTGNSDSTSVMVNFNLSASSGNISVAGANSCGTGASFSLPITVKLKPNTPAITLSPDNSISSSALYGNQWYFNNNILNGDTNQVFAATANGSYYTIVDSLGCYSEPSNTINIVNIGIDENSDIPFRIIPNPVIDILQIESLNANYSKATIFNSNGEKVIEKDFSDSSTINVASLSAGIYIIRLQSDSKIIYSRFIKE